VIRGRERQLQVPAPFPDFQVRQDIMGAAHLGFRGVAEPARAFRPDAPGAQPHPPGRRLTQGLYQPRRRQGVAVQPLQRVATTLSSQN
jgi:hypothetical protein